MVSTHVILRVLETELQKHEWFCDHCVSQQYSFTCKGGLYGVDEKVQIL
jgi:hypothetical protein